MIETINRLEIKEIIKQLKCNEIYINEIPDEYETIPEIIQAERKLGLRRKINSGYDELRQHFFVNEFILTIKLFSREEEECVDNKIFETFEEYYDYLDGDIYSDSCYVGYEFSDNFSKSIELDYKRLTKNRDLLNGETVDELLLNTKAEYQEVLSRYEEAEKRKQLIKKYIKKIEKCTTVKDLQMFRKEYEKSELYNLSEWRNIFNLSFFFWEFIYKDVFDRDRFNLIMEYFSKGEYPESIMIKGICSIYDAIDVLDKYNYSLGSKQTIYKYKRRLREHVEALQAGNITFVYKGGFNKFINYYYTEIRMLQKKSVSGRNRIEEVGKIYRFYEKFDEFAKARENDLRNCDISGDIKLEINTNDYLIDETTFLPKKDRSELNADEMTYTLEKKYINGRFYVFKNWFKDDEYIGTSERNFKYFFNFVSYLKGDLSKADLLFCEDLVNIKGFKEINFSGAILTSNLNDKFGLKYKKHKNIKAEEFENITKNEIESAEVLCSSRDLVVVEDDETNELIEKIEYTNIGQSINYISDIHLIHKIRNTKCKTKEDIIVLINKIAADIKAGLAYDWQKNINADMLLIGGDVSSDFELFKLFVEALNRVFSIGRRNRNINIIFILGNHEFWSFPESTVEEIVGKYRSVIENNGMKLLQNDLFYKNEDDECGVISYDELNILDEEELSNILKCTRVAILGGVGFSGYNKEFNAQNGIYRDVVSRKEEIKQSEIFEKIYNKLVPTLRYTNSVIFTHTPKSDWSSNPQYIEKFVYVSGHTHRNYFHDDGVIRIYADNQSGYKSKTIQIKNFSIENEFDYFSKYEDGIYKITTQQYNDFYRGKNITMDFKRKVEFIYMLKNNGYYCFILRNKSGKLTLLNGGALKSLEYADINYYYDNMNKVISVILEPLVKYTEYQQKIAEEIKKIGGAGYIHGSIIDIDFNNHIYVNPLDMTITAYWAADMIDKIAYPCIPDLLKVKCPYLYLNYQKLIAGNQKYSLEIRKNNELIDKPMLYDSTDIYRASREIKKMQKLDSHILSVWYEKTNENALPQK